MDSFMNMRLREVIKTDGVSSREELLGWTAILENEGVLSERELSQIHQIA